MEPTWYVSHALLLASFALFAVAILQLRKRGGLGPGMGRLVNVVSVIAVVATLGMAVHLFSALGAESIADGQPSLTFEVQKWSKTILNTLWGLCIVALAAVGGLTRTRWVTDSRSPWLWLAAWPGAWPRRRSRSPTCSTPSFQVASLIFVWAVVVGMTWALRTGSSSSPRSSVDR